MARLQLFVVAAVFLVAGAQAVIKDKCAFAVGKMPFDAEKMVGSWHVISCISNRPEQEPKYCAKYDINYKKGHDDEQFQVKFTALDKDRKKLSYEGISKPYIAPSIFLGVMKKTEAETFEEVFKEAIVATDYDNYAVYIGCREFYDPITKDFGRRYRAAVLSRKPTLSDDIKNTLINVLSGYNLDASEFKTIEHKDCQ